jgi:AraC-like DNA-binding protein
MLDILASPLPTPIGEPASEHARRRRRLLDGVFGYIDGNFRDPIGLTHVAAAVGHVPAYLTDVVRGTTGRPVQKWIAERRMAEARRLLTMSDEPVRAVAAAAGYSDAAYFSRAFIRASGQSPSRWRRIYAGRTAQDTLHAGDVAAAFRHVAAARGAFAAAAAQAERDEVLLSVARAALPLAVTMNHRDPASGVWRHHNASQAAFTDDVATIPLLLHGCTSTELVLEHSYFAYYRRLAQVKSIAGFFKIPLIVDGVCTGALCATVRDPNDLNRLRRFLLVELARAYSAASATRGVRTLPA